MPEISKKSLISCPVLGGFELFVVGKNFAKDTKMIFQSQKMTGEVVWQEIVVPDKEYLQQVRGGEREYFVDQVDSYRYGLIPIADPFDLHNSPVRGEAH